MKLFLWLTTFSSSQLVFAHGISEAGKAAMLSGGYLKYIWLGAFLKSYLASGHFQ